MSAPTPCKHVTSQQFHHIASKVTKAFSSQISPNTIRIWGYLMQKLIHDAYTRLAADKIKSAPWSTWGEITHDTGSHLYRKGAVHLNRQVTSCSKKRTTYGCTAKRLQKSGTGHPVCDNATQTTKGLQTETATLPILGSCPLPTDSAFICRYLFREITEEVDCPSHS